MECRSQRTIGGILLLITMIGLYTGPAMAIEEPKFKLIEQMEDFELREYESYIVAEAFVEGEFDEVGNQGFRRLASVVS